MIAKNNPFNIRNSKSNKWLGQTGSRKGFCIFDCRSTGIRAAVKLVMINYRKFGVNTILKIVRRFCPDGDGDNNSLEYARQVVKKTGIYSAQVLNSEDEYVRVLVAMSQVEGNPVTSDEIFSVMNLYNLRLNPFEV